MSDATKHQFAGCDRLLGQYRIIGGELQRLQEALSGTLHYTLSKSRSSEYRTKLFQHFRQSLVFIPLEVLHSYRDDLLNPEIRAERLFIAEDSYGWKVPSFAFLGIVVAIALGLYAASVGASFVISFSLTIIISSPFVAIWHLVPRDGSLRRLRYAQWISDEIHYRGGGSGPRERRFGRRKTGLLSPLWNPDTGSEIGEAASRVRYH